jgi:hypothetical protein
MRELHDRYARGQRCCCNILLVLGFSRGLKLMITESDLSLTHYHVQKAKAACNSDGNLPGPGGLLAGNRVRRNGRLPVGVEPLEELDCDLGRPRPGNGCKTPSLLDLDWKIWDGTTLVKSRAAEPIRADAWSATSTSCILGGFEGKRNGHFILELNVKRDAGRLKDLHPRVQIVRYPG